MEKKLIFLIFICIGCVAFAQIPKESLVANTHIFPKEKVALTTNTNVLLAGELLQYKAYSLTENNIQSELSKIVYVSLRSESDSIIFSHKLKIENGTANGDFFLPATLNSGSYRLIGYTNFSRNNLETPFVQNYLYVLNTFKKTEKKSDNNKDTLHLRKKETPLQPESSGFDEISIATDADTYSFRKKVELVLTGNGNNIKGNYALSVRKLNPIEAPALNGKTKNENLETFFVPEMRGELISGVVISKTDNLPVANKEVSLTIPGNGYVLKLSKTNKYGRFFFSISEDYNTEKSIIQLTGSTNENSGYSIKMDEKNISLKDNNSFYLKLDPTIKEWLNERSIQLQIENAYFEIKKDSILKTNKSPNFYENLGTVFELDNYTRFSTVRETFVEIITLAAIRGTGESARFIVNNEYDPNGTAKFNDIPPLVLMDGMQINNNTELIDYNARNIKNIRVVATPYRYGPTLYSGIIAVQTKDGNFLPEIKKGTVEEIKLPPPVKQKIYYKPDYSKVPSLTRIPDYRVQLLWIPNIDLSENTFSTSFFTSDVEGVFEIVLEGFSDNGRYISAKKHFSVLKK